MTQRRSNRAAAGPGMACAQPSPLDLAGLHDLTLRDLRDLWIVHMGRSKCPAQRRLLIRELAWRTQERRFGGLDAQTSRLLEAAVRAAVKRQNQTARGEDEPAPSSRRPPSASPARQSLARMSAGSRLVRTWPPESRTRHEVVVLGEGHGFRYQEKTYKSLSEVARAITGTRWSGPRFFGLAARRHRDDEERDVGPRPPHPRTRPRPRQPGGGGGGAS